MQTLLSFVHIAEFLQLFTFSVLLGLRVDLFNVNALHSEGFKGALASTYYDFILFFYVFHLV